MSKKMIWGGTTLMVLLIGISLFLLMRNTDPKPPIIVYKDVEPSKENPPPAEPGYKWVWHHNHWDKVPIAETGEVVDKETKQNLPPIAEVDKPAPDVPNKKVSTDRVGSDYPLLIETENPVIGKPIFLRTIDGTGIDIDWESLSPTELAEKIKQIERGKVPLPDGYYYRHYSDMSLLLDERGFPILHKRYEPFISVSWQMRFKPSPEQLVQYRELIRRRDALKIDTPSSPEIDVIRAELDEFVSTHVGPVPVLFQSSLGAPPEIFKVKEAREVQLMRDLKAEIFRQLNLEHLLDHYWK